MKTYGRTESNNCITVQIYTPNWLQQLMAFKLFRHTSEHQALVNQLTEHLRGEEWDTLEAFEDEFVPSYGHTLHGDGRIDDNGSSALYHVLTQYADGTMAVRVNICLYRLANTGKFSPVVVTDALYRWAPVRTNRFIHA